MGRLAMAMVAAFGRLALLAPGAMAQGAPPSGITAPADHILLTVFLKHDQSQSIDEILARLEKQDFWRRFPPEGVEVGSWNVAMGPGQVVTLKVPPEKLRAVNLALEQGAWGAFRTAVYAGYDLLPVVAEFRRRAERRTDR
ncbi:MAG: hypothetical protein ACE5ED_07095 [Rhodothalassiaceae bacterium]